jgi:sulfhydrogenase subunit beta (sulfur reductase)
METNKSDFMKTKVIDSSSLNLIFQALVKNDYKLIGPVVHNNCIIYDEISSVSDLPVAVTDEQDKAYYRIKKNDRDSFFYYNTSPYSWKKFLFPTNLKLWEADKVNNSGFEIKKNEPEIPSYAFIGVKSCELDAIMVQDKVFLKGEYIDTYYQKVREKAFIISTNCTKANKTCFCVSMKTGPKATIGFDISMTEVFDASHHYFVLHSGSEKGNAILADIPSVDANEFNLSEEIRAIKNAEKQIRAIDTNHVKNILYKNIDNEKWDEIAKRCLSCANCTLVCPTCFCNTVEDVTDLKGDHAERWRRWDSCFNLEYAKVAGGNFRTSAKARYRQWLTHKFASWIDQFDTSGCVGCGRCITWCPVEIDVTEEINYFHKNTS